MTASPDETSLAARLRARIAAEGPITVADYMAAANAHYYATRDPFGADGDFVTAPEISQMFGELIGLWCADVWHRAGRPADAAWAELGPGRGTLAADARRAMAKAGWHPPVHFVETSPTLRGAQAARVPDASWHDAVATLPAAPLIVVANEFFDALPIRQTAGGVEARVDWRDGGFARVAAGVIVEDRPAATAVVSALAAHLVRHGGAMLAIDYGPIEHGPGDTLQAVRGHHFADPWAAPGDHDLSAHVDFGALARAATGLRAFGPVPQGDWLTRMGIGPRAAALGGAAPERMAAIEADRARLVDAAGMGGLFKVLALTLPDWPAPAGFA